ncbi:MAG TPA: murein biosynthesis integral membrane protein MurJ [Propionicimonas sp.]|uniref:murein biosynthesis integral membrane protein MurJ n=1 Tax=Propionicimonas sp. TaxID=1955623 RepID=UPI002F414A41
MSDAQAGGRRLISATAVMASGTMVSRILGLVRTALLAFVLGNGTRQVEAFNFANTLPTSLYLLLAGGTLNNVLVPQIVRAVTHDEDGGKAFIDRIITGFLMLLGALTLIVTVATPLIVSIYISPLWRTDQMAEHWQSMLLMSYICMPQLFFYGVFFLLGQVLNAREKFGPMMWAPLTNNLVSIIVFGAYLWIWGNESALSGKPFTEAQAWLLALGSTIGIVVQTVVLLPFLKRAGVRYRPRFDLKGTGLGRTFHVAKWMVGYVALTSLAQIVVTRLASAAAPSAGGTGAGAGWTVYQNAYLIWILPHSLLTVSLATAMLPSASRFAVAGDRAGVAAETSRALRLATTFLVPAAVGLAVLADPITRLIFGNGSGQDDYIFIAWALVAFAIGLIPFTVQYLYLRAYYAMDNTRTPFLLQIWISVANAVLAVAFVVPWDNPGTIAARLALSYSASYFLGAFLTHRSLRKRLPELPTGETLQHLGRLLVASVPAGALAWVITWWFERYPSFLLRAVGLALAGLSAVLVFFFTAKRLGIPETTSLLEVLRRPRRDDGDAVEAIIEETDKEDDRRAGHLNPDPDGTGVFVPVAPHDGPPAEVLDFPEPPIAGSPEAEVTTGRMLGDRFRLEEQLAFRDRTQTWRAHDIILGRAVLVHLLDGSDPRTTEVLRLGRDAALATDSRFLRVLDVVDSEPGTEPYLVYEYAAGQTLEKVLRTGPLTGVETAWVVREVADALVGLHAQGLYHRHLSPATLLVTASGNVKVVGFGVNEANQAADTHLNGEAADVRALGQLLYACLVARWPGGDRYGLAAAPVVEGHWVLPSRVRSGVAPAVDQVVDRILSPVPQAHATRLTTAQDVTTQLSLVLGPMSASHDLRARLNPSIDPDDAPPPPVSTVAPPMPTPATSRYSASASVAGDEDPGDDTEPFVDAALSHGDSFTPVPPPATTPGAAASPQAAEAVRPRLRLRIPPALLARRSLLIAGIAVLVVAILVAAFWGQRPAAPTAVATGSVKVTRATDFDPKADGGGGAENPKQAKLAIDGDPATVWRTERYRKLPTLGGIKPGVGLVLDLGAVRHVTGVEVQLNGSSTNVELRTPKAPADAAPMKSIDQWTKLAGTDDATATLTLDLPQAQDTRYVLVYLTSLAPLGDGYFRSGIAEITVRGD